MASLHTFTYPDGTKGREIRYRYNGKQYSQRIPKGTTELQATSILKQFDAALIKAKTEGKIFINPMKKKPPRQLSLWEEKLILSLRDKGSKNLSDIDWAEFIDISIQTLEQKFY